MEKFLVERRQHPLLRDVEQLIYCFPDAHQGGRSGSMGISVIMGECGHCEGAVLSGMSRDGYGGTVAHDKRLLPGSPCCWSQQFKSRRVAKAWIRRAIRIYGAGH